MMAVTLVDVARDAGVSRSLASLVMRNARNVSDERRKAVIDSARRLGYRPNLNARQLASTRADAIGVVVADLHNPIYAEILDGVSEALVQTGYNLLLASGYNEARRETASIDTLLAHRVDGLLLIGTLLTKAQIRELVCELPTVLVGHQLPGFDIVTNNDSFGARLATEHLLDLGHQRVAHIDGGSAPGSKIRRRVFLQVMKERGMDAYASVMPSDYSEEGGRRAAEALLALGARPTAIFAACDLSALGAMDTLLRAGLKVPADVSIVGYDGAAFSRLNCVSLSTVEQPFREMGHRGLGLLLGRVGSLLAPRQTLFLEPTFVRRRSSGPPPRSRGGKPVIAMRRSIAVHADRQ
jgi:DNA-binding LacI/PurR family transcriptional regulator